VQPMFVCSNESCGKNSLTARVWNKTYEEGVIRVNADGHTNYGAKDLTVEVLDQSITCEACGSSVEIM